MKIFLSWSGMRSRKVAEALRVWLNDVIQLCEPWLSSEDIEKGARWGIDLGRELENTDVGIICLTPENLKAPWILFESGALSKALDRSRVCTFLFGMRPSDLDGPLVQFQSTQANETDVLKLLRTLNRELGDQARTEEQIKRAFSRWWPELSSRLNSISGPATEPREVRTDRDMLEELLGLVRLQIKRDFSNEGLSYSSDLSKHSLLYHDREVTHFLSNIDIEESKYNAEPWAKPEPTAMLGSELDGLWSGRWNGAPAGKTWEEGVATIATTEDFLVALYRDKNFIINPFLLVARREEERLIGRFFNLRVAHDSAPWVGTVVNRDRIDGQWERGRWEFRR